MFEHFELLLYLPNYVVFFGWGKEVDTTPKTDM